MTFDFGAVIVGLITAILTAGASYGIFKEKVKRLEMDLTEHIKEDDANHDRMVSYQYFNAIVGPIQRAIDEIQSDIKKILTIVSERN